MFDIENVFFLLSLSLTYGTRIHTNQHESRAYTRLLFRLIAGSRGTLMPSHALRACFKLEPAALAPRSRLGQTIIRITTLFHHLLFPIFHDSLILCSFFQHKRANSYLKYQKMLHTLKQIPVLFQNIAMQIAN